MPNSRIFIGNLPSDVRQNEVEDIFSKYGKITSCNVKGGRGGTFAFVEFDDARDAEDAIRGRDGYDFDGRRIRVEFTKGRQFDDRRGGDRGGFDRGDRGGDRGGRSDFRGGRGGNRPRSDYRVVVSGLPASGSWQDLKDHMREVGDVLYTDVQRDGTGVVEYGTLDAMKNAVRKLDDSKFRSHEGETAYIKVKEDYQGARRSRSPIRRDSRSRSRSRS